MADITIHRCTLRVVRRAGWSWGAEPDALLKAAIGALPLLIARKLADHFPHETETTISARLSLRVPIGLSELMALAANAGSVVEADELKPNAALDQRITAAIERALAGELAGVREQSLAEVSEKTATLSVNPERQRRTVRVHPVFQLLLAWKYLGESEVHLASFSEAELQAWYDVLVATLLRFAAAAGPLKAGAVSRLVQAFQQQINVAGPNRAAVLRSSLITLLDAALELKIVSGHEPELDLDRAAHPAAIDLSLDPETFSHEPSLLATETTLEKRRAERSAPLDQSHLMQESEATSRRITEMDFRVSSVLPFLLLSPLAKIGYFDAVAATLESINLSNQAGLFAAALAFKVLSPPQRGWRRKDEDLTAAAVFAGLDAAPAGDDLAELARKMTGHLTALDSIVSYALIKAHDPASPLLLLRTLSEADGKGLVLVETDGLVPIAWGANPDDLKPSLKYFSENHLLVDQGSADIDTLLALHASGYRFITDAPPSRGEMWRELRRPPVRRWYTNDFDTAEVELVLAAERLAGSAEAALVWEAINLQRPAFPTTRNAELDRSLTMAAALSLGTISWTLWRQRETATPRLALERFGNLDGRVRFRPNTIQVQLPLGRRQRDLYEHGLLDPVHDVPWFDGRTVEFLGG